MAKMLPVVAIVYETKLRTFFADERLQEYRATNNPHIKLTIDEVEPSDMEEVIATARVPVALVCGECSKTKKPSKHIGERKYEMYHLQR